MLITFLFSHSIFYNLYSKQTHTAGRSMSFCNCIPSPGPICETWLKLVGAEIIRDRLSAVLLQIKNYIMNNNKKNHMIQEATK